MKHSSRQDDFQGVDFYDIDDLLSEEQRSIRSAVRQFSKQEIAPYIEDWAERQFFPKELVPKLGALGVLGPMISPKYGGGGLDAIAYGLIMQEIERIDSGMRSTISVQGALVMYPIETFGSEEQKQKYLPQLACGKLLGCFGLTEPDHGSNPAGLQSRFTDQGDHVLLRGSKSWISNAPHADIALVWAKNEDNRIQGLILERGMEGFSTPKTEGKWSLRASSTGDLVFDQVRVPKTHILPERDGLSAPMMCLDKARYGIAWGSIGVAMDAYESARKYSLERRQFDRPIASFQLQQKKLAEMLTEITKAQLLALRLGQLMNKGTASSAQISMAKRNNVASALEIVREARQMHGAMGVSNNYSIMRHMMNLESVITYEGTHDIHLLILGAEITGIQAFS